MLFLFLLTPFLPLLLFLLFFLLLLLGVLLFRFYPPDLPVPGQRLPGLLPPLGDDDALASAAVLSLAGQFDLAVLGFEAYVRSFPKSDRADDAQVYVCGAYLNAGKYDKAVDACDAAIRTYPAGDAVPEAYYRKGIALRGLKDVEKAREAFEAVDRKSTRLNSSHT